MLTHPYLRATLASMALLLLITVASRAEAAEEQQQKRPYWDVFSCCSYHKVRGVYNEFNPGFGREWPVINNNWSTGLTMAINSKKVATLYWDLAWKPVHLGPLNIGLGALCAIGYDGWNIGCIPPMPVLEYQYNKDLRFESLVTPEVITLRIKRRF